MFKMFQVNALIYESKVNKGKYIAECLEIPQIGVGDDEAEAKRELLSALEAVIESAKEDNTARAVDTFSSDDCIEGFNEIILNKTAPVEIKRTPYLEIRFYREVK